MCILSFCDKSKTTAPEKNDGQWTTYTTADGLPFDQIGAIAFTPNGDLWCVPLIPEVGGGVVCYDGNTWKQYTTEDGLGENIILWMENTLAVSSDGVLWVATWSGGVSSFDGETWTTYITADGLLGNNIAGVGIAPNGDIWCAHPTPDCGLSRFDGETWTTYTTNDMGISFCNLINVAFDAEGKLWAGGGIVLSHHNETWTSFSDETGMPQPIALYMDIAPDGKIWICGDGVSCYDGSAWKYFSFKQIGANGKGEGLVPLAVDSENVVWVGVFGEGVFQYDGNSWTKFVSEDGPSLTDVFSIEVAPDGAIWFGTASGISRYQPE